MDLESENTSLPNPRALIYPTPVEGHQYKNVLLIDSSVMEYQQFIDSANADTFPIVYSIMSSKTDLLALLKTNFTSISRLGLVFHSSSVGDSITFLDREPLFIVGEVSANQQFIKDVINEFQIKNIDYLACNTLNYPNWTNYYDSISQDTGVVVGASNDKTGNIKYGGDWVLETTSENVELIYFTQSIEYYQYLLASFTVNNITYTTGGTNTCYVSGFVNGLSGDITIPSTVVDSAGWNFTVTSIGKVFEANTNITSISIPSGVTSLQNYEFAGCTNLTSVSIPNVTSIGGYAFRSCVNLTSVSIPNVTSIGGYAFKSCVNLTSISMPNVTSIGNGAFEACTRLTNVNMPNVISIGIDGFSGCSGLTNVTIPNSVTSIEYGAFYNCTSLSSINMPNVTSIGGYAFEACTSLSSISMPNVTSIGNGAFYNCTSLSSITIPNSVTSIGNNTFYNCTSLSSVSMPNVTSIEDGAFDGCTNLTSVSIPNVTSIEDGAFYNCTSLTSLFFINQRNLQTVGRDVFNNPSIASVTYYNTSSVDELIAASQTLRTQLNTLNSSISYIYIPPLTISSVSPVSGSTLGGTSVTITGTGFVSGATSVKFGGVDASNISIDSSTNITCTTPALSVGLFNVTVTTPGGSATNAFTYQAAPISNICFPAGTPITCNQGTIPIECLNPKIHTIRGKKIVAITKTITQDKYLVCFEKGALQENIPSQKTIISKNHEIFYKGEMMQAKEFLNDFENVKKVKYTGEILYNVLMDQPDKMMVNNLICETLHPVNSIAKLYKLIKNLSVEEQNIVITKFNQYVIENNIYNKKITKR